MQMGSHVNSGGMESSDSDFDVIGSSGIRDTNSNLDASNIDAAEENIVATVLRTDEEMTHNLDYW